MRESLKEAVEKQSQDSQERAQIEQYLSTLNDSKPVKSAYWRAMLEGDNKTVEKILTSKAIFRARTRAKTSPHQAKYLEHLIQHLKKLEAD